MLKFVLHIPIIAIQVLGSQNYWSRKGSVISHMGEQGYNRLIVREEPWTDWSMHQVGSDHHVDRVESNISTRPHWIYQASLSSMWHGEKHVTYCALPLKTQYNKNVMLYSLMKFNEA